MEELKAIAGVLPILLEWAKAAGPFGTAVMGLLYWLARRDSRALREQVDAIQAERIAEGQKALDLFHSALAERERRREADESSTALMQKVIQWLPLIASRTAANPETRS